MAQRNMFMSPGHVPPFGAQTGLAGIVMLYFIFPGGAWSTTAWLPGTATAARAKAARQRAMFKLRLLVSMIA
jgi:hypothetical protein